MNIISKEIIYESNTTVAVIVGLLTLLTILISGMMWVVHLNGNNNYYDNFGRNVVMIWVSSFLICVVLICLSTALWKVPSNRYTYEVTFDSTEAVNEAFEKWNFISYEEGIYKFEDKAK